MGFFIFMLAASLVLPAVMLGAGSAFEKKSPDPIRTWYGYRTQRSMKSREAWQFAHNYCGRAWKLCGGILLPASLLAMLPLRRESVGVIGTAGAAVSAVQLLVLFGTVAATEHALKQKFEKKDPEEKHHG